MIRPLRTLHRWLIPAVALGSLPLIGLALAQRPAPAVMESLPSPLQSSELAADPAGRQPATRPSGELVVGGSVLSWVDEGSSLLLSTEENLAPDLQAYLTPAAPTGGLPTGAIRLGAVRAPGTTRLAKPNPSEAVRQGETNGSFLVVYSAAHDRLVGSVRLDAALPGGPP